MLVDALLAANRTCPKKLAVDDGRLTLTYRQLTLLAVVLRDIVGSATAGDKVGIMLPAGSRFPAALFGVLWSRKIAVPLNFLLTAAQLRYVVKDAGLDVLLTVEHFQELTEQLEARVIYLDKLPLKRKLVWKMFLPMPALPNVDAQDTAVVLYTSGTTSQPKGVELTYRNLRSNCIDVMLSLDMQSDQSFLDILPPFHVFGLTCNVLIPITLGASVYAIPRFNPAAVVRAVMRNRISIITAIPSMYAAILRLKSAKPDSFSSVVLAVSGGEPLAERIRTGFEEKFALTLREGYGLTETSPVLAAGSVKHHKAGSVGKPIRNVQCRIVDHDGRDLPTGSDGELWVKGPGIMKGYLNRPDDTKQVIDDRGWFKTGDIARLDEDGFISITGRSKEMLIIGGENVAPREIEIVLEQHHDVLQAAVIGVADQSRGEAPIAFVICREGAEVTESQLRSFARKSLAGFKVPKQVHIRDDLPTTPTGKILKRKLRELL